MDEYIDNLKENIISSTSNIDDIIIELKEIRESIITVGSGGSKIVATYAAHVLEKKNNCITITVDPRDLNYINLNNYKNLLIASYSGKNFGVKTSLEKDINKYLLTGRKTKIADEHLLHYEMPHEHSFISIGATIIPMAIFLKYYLNDKFYDVLDLMFKSVDKSLFIDIKNDFINVYSGLDTRTTQTFLESCLVESGIASTQIHNKYDYCHGRSTLNKTHDNQAIYLKSTNKELDDTLIDVLKQSMKDYLVIKTIFEDEILTDFYMTLQVLYLLRNIALSKSIDLKDIVYDKEAVKKLYFFKGSM